MLSIDTIARVAVNVVRTAAQPATFDTGLLLVKDSSYAASRRLKSYANSSEAAAGLIADGFSASTEAYKAAQKYFSASPSSARSRSRSTVPITRPIRQTVSSVSEKFMNG